MRKIISLCVFLFASKASFAQFDPYADTLNSHSCKPSNCEQYTTWVYGGSVSTSITGSCKVLGQISATDGVEAENCTYPVGLDSYADTLREELYDSDYNEIYYDDRIQAFGDAYTSLDPYVPYYSMYEYSYCDGSEPTIYIPPPKACQLSVRRDVAKTDGIGTFSQERS
jgi:hypothetical protein